MRYTHLFIPLIALLSMAGVAHAKSRTVAVVTDVPTPVIVSEPTPTPLPSPTVAPTPLPTAVPTPLPTVAPTPLPTEVPVPVVIPTPAPISTPVMVTPQPVLSPPIVPALNFQMPVSSRSDVSVDTPVMSQQIKQAAVALTATPPTEQQRVLLNVASHTASATLSNPSTDYSYTLFSGLNRSTTLGLDSLAAILAVAGIYVAVRSGSTMNV